MKKIYIMYEIESRELQSRIHIANQLLRSGFEVTLFQHSILWKIACFAEPGFICLKSTSYQFDSIIKFLVRRGFILISWQEEGLHHFHGQNQSPVFSKNTSSLIHCYFAWHPADAELAIRTGVAPSSIRIVGNARFEVLLASSTNSNSDLNLGNRVLVLTNFDKSALTYDFTKDANLDEDGRQLAEEYWSAEKKSGQQNGILYEELFARLASEKTLNPRVRPYFYEKDPRHLQFDIDTDSYFTISESLRDCDVLIHYGSTGGIEATVLGIPNLLLASSTEGIDERILESASYFSSVDSLVDEVLKLVNNPSHAQAIAANQHENQVRAYEFNLRKTDHTKQLVKFIELNHVPHVQDTLLIVRVKLGLDSLVTQTKYMIKKFFSPVHMVKATRIHPQSLKMRVWDPLRKDLPRAKIRHRGRAISFRNTT
jgi:surface carbohydrate biosynthesis protein